MISAPAHPSENSRGSFRWLAPALLVALVALAYANTLRSPFLFDDTGAVVNNPTIRRLDSLAVLRPPADGSTTTGRPVVNASFALNYAVSGDQPWSYHVFNVFIHLLATLALYGLVRRTLASEKLAARFGADAGWSAFFAAALWAVHPLLTESVTCIAQRTESLCGLFYLLTLACFVRGVSTKGRSTPWLGASVIACLAGMATKEVMVTAPVLVLLYDRTFLAGSFAGAVRRRPRFYAFLAATWLLLAGLVLANSGARGAAAGFDRGIPVWNYLLQQSAALVLYLKLSLWPHPLVLDYGTVFPHALAEVWWQALLVLVLLGATAWALVRRPVAGFVGACFFLILAPSSSVVPLVTQTMAEHRMYLPLAALAAAFALLVRRLGRAASAAFLSAAIVLLAGLTVARNHDYRDGIALWSDCVQRVPHNPRAHNNLAWSLEAAGRPADADREYARAVELRPDYVSAHYNWGVSLLDRHRPADAAAQFAAAVAAAPGHVDAQVNLGNALTQLGRADEAVAHYESALRLKPADDIEYDLGVALLGANRPADAAAHLASALRGNPRWAEAHYQLGRAETALGRLDEAEREYVAAIEYSPDHVGAHRELGLFLAERGQYDVAAGHFRAIVRIRPDDAEAQANLGNALLLDGKVREAIACYEISLRLQPNDARTQSNLDLAREALSRQQ